MWLKSLSQTWQRDRNPGPGGGGLTVNLTQSHTINLRFAICGGKREITEELKIIFPQRQDNGAVTWETKGLLSSSHSSFPASFPKLKDSRKQVPAHGPLEFCSHW